MFLTDLKSSLLRRWYFVIAGLLITVGLALTAFYLIPPKYEIRASVVLLPPPTTVGSNGNPYMLLGGLNQAVDVLTHSLNSDASQRPILAAHVGASFAANPDPTTSGPIVSIAVDGESTESAISTMDAVMRAVPEELTRLQEQLSVSKQSRISVMTISLDQEPVPLTKTRTRGVLAVVAVGLAATVLICGLLDGLMLTRRRGREKTEGPVQGRAAALIPAPEHRLTQDETPRRNAITEPSSALNLRAQPTKRIRMQPRPEPQKVPLSKTDDPLRIS